MKNYFIILDKLRYLNLFLVLVIFSNIFAQESRPKVGLVLSGGGAKGMAHIGTLKMLDSLGIQPDYIAGTSMGGIIGALYSIGYSGKELEDLVVSIDWNALFTDKPPRDKLPYLVNKYDGKHQITFGLDGFTPKIPDAIVLGQKVSLLFSRLTQDYASVKDFDKLPIPYRCVAADLVTGNEVVLSGGSLARAMRSTMSIPTVFKPVSWGDSLLIDGGMVNNFPADILLEMGADFIIGVDVGAPLLPREKIKNIMDVFEQTTNLVGIERVEENKKLVDILISPDISDYSAADFEKEKVVLLLEEGDKVAQAHEEELKDLAETLVKFEEKDHNTPTRIMLDSIKVIYRIEIAGNKLHSFDFIYNQIGLNPGDILSDQDLENRITGLYALGYFETIDFDVERIDEGLISLRINVVERTKRELRFGLRYDDYFKLVGLLSYIGTDLLIPGGRLESDLQFAGLTTFNFKPSLPSRSLDFPIFPFLRYYFWDIPVAIYDSLGSQIARYDDRGNSFSFGMDILLHKSWIIEAEYAFEYLNVKPDVALRDTSQFPRFEDELREIIISTTFDKIDNVLLPRSGVHVKAQYNGSRRSFGSDLDFDRFEVTAKWYLTLKRKHTFMFYGFYGTGRSQPVYKHFFHGGPNTFVGLDYMQLVANRMTVARVDYRFEYKKDIFLKLVANLAFDYELNGESPPAGNNIIHGFAVGIMLQSIIGPVELMYARGDQSPLYPGPKQYNVYFKAGYVF